MKSFKFRPRQWVLVRDTDDVKWALAQFSHMGDEDDDYHFYVCGGAGWIYCIPYEGNENLIGKTDDYVEPYEPKVGDFVVSGWKEDGKECKWVAIVKGEYEEDFYQTYYGRLIVKADDDRDSWYDESCDSQTYTRAASEEEIQFALEGLHKDGKDWDEDKKEIVDYVPTYEPKDGDFVYIKGANEHILIYRDLMGHSVCAYAELSDGYLFPKEAMAINTEDIDEIRLATEEEKNLFLSKLHEIGKDWDAEKKGIVDWKWKPSYKSKYYYINSVFLADTEIWTNSLVDEQRYKKGNCFRTYEEANVMADKLSTAIKNVK